MPTSTVRRVSSALFSLALLGSVEPLSAQCREELFAGPEVYLNTHGSAALEGDTLMLGSSDGMLHVYGRSGASWIEGTPLVPLGASGSVAGFGAAVAIDGTRAVVGSPKEDNDSGAVYAYENRAGSWSLEERIGNLGSLGYAAELGLAADVSGDWMVASEPYLYGQTGGNVRVYEHDTGGWVERTRLVASDKFSTDSFGAVVAIQGNLVAVGAQGQTSATGRPCGAVYLFEHSGTAWVETKLTPSDPTDVLRFGESLSLDGDTLAIGASNWEGPATRPGRVYIFERSGTSWSESEWFSSSQASDGDFFGIGLALEGDRLFVGAERQVAGDGRVFAFERSAGIWSEVASWDLACVTGEPQRFGYAVALSGSRAVARDERGWVSLHELGQGAPCASPRVGLNPSCYTSSLPTIGGSWVATLDTSAHPGASLTMILGQSECALLPPSRFGQLLIDLSSARIFVSYAVPSGGVASYLRTVPNDPLLVGLPIWTQAAVIGPFGVELCNAIDIVAGA